MGTGKGKSQLLKKNTQMKNNSLLVLLRTKDETTKSDNLKK